MAASGASKKIIRGVQNPSGCKDNHSRNINQLIVFNIIPYSILFSSF